MLKQTIFNVHYPSIESIRKVNFEDLSPAGVRSVLLFKNAMRSLPENCEFHVDDNEQIHIGIACAVDDDLNMYDLESVLLTYCIQAGISTKEMDDVCCYAYNNNMWLELSEDESHYNFVG